MGEQVQLRFRHTQGDIGPLSIPFSFTVQQTRERLFAAWPKDGTLGEFSPNSAGDLRMILSGKFLESSETLQGLRPQMGEVKPDTVVTVHVVVRATAMSKTSGAKLGEKEDGSGCSCCVM